MTKTTDTHLADIDNLDPFEAAMEMGDIKGRSPWEDAWHRLLKNKAQGGGCQRHYHGGDDSAGFDRPDGNQLGG
jgi:hypothetical protein